MLPCLCSRKSLSSISSVSCRSSNLVSIPRSRNQFFPQSYNSCFQYSVPLRLLPLCLSRLHLCTRLDIYVNVFLTISSRHSSFRSFVFTFVFPIFPSAIFNFYHLAFVDVPSYSVPITFNLFSARL